MNKKQSKLTDEFGFPISRKLSRNFEPLRPPKTKQSKLGGVNMTKYSSKETESEKDNREVLKTKDLPLEIAEWERMDKNPSNFPNTDYFFSYAVTLEDGTKAVINSASKRLKNLVGLLAENFGAIAKIPQGILGTEGEGFDKQFYYDVDEE
ncbi:MAG: hypothetical protein ACOC44_18320 [Promethearchaeia archaeon]